MTAEDRVASALRTLPGQHIVSSSFGAQSAVMLHLVTRQKPDIPVVLIDTGYLFPETYRFIDELTDRLALNLKVFQPEISNAWQEARYGKRWEQDLRGLEDYNQNNKVEPMQRAIEELNVGTWFSGLRRNQSIDRAKIPFIESSGDRFKVYPIADWTDKDVFNYLQEHKLPYHPLWEKGYVSIGDVHTTKSLAEVDSIEETRFFGLKRECGLHELDFGKSIAEVKSA
ncbi:MAG: phosphoadenylyl-sulfate reductase [Proteobacteria bacterium]|nr:phosphoadenylyl-sulfate reductase [Pseudomonadota bacterium]